MSIWNLSFRQGRVSGPGSNCSYQLKTTPGSQILVTFLEFDLAPALESVGCAMQAVTLEEPIHSSTSLLLQKKIFCGNQVSPTFKALALCCAHYPPGAKLSWAKQPHLVFRFALAPIHDRQRSSCTSRSWLPGSPPPTHLFSRQKFLPSTPSVLQSIFL